jgi:hypothetical protein
MATCPKCGGGRKEKCWACNGSAGEQKTYGGDTKWYPCTVCSGTGVRDCSRCSGTGQVSS